MVDMINMLKIVLVMTLFYSFCITGFVYYLPNDAKAVVSIIGNSSNPTDFNSVSTEVHSTLTRQSSIPLIDIGALVFYSGNIVLDLLLNFAFAIPQMITFLIIALFSLVGGIPSYIQSLIQIFVSVAIGVWYVVSLIQLVTNIRSGRVV
jgi:hypothetical protein